MMPISIYHAARNFGWLLGVIGFILGGIAIIVVLNIHKDTVAPIAPVGNTIKVAPATGIQGYDVFLLCNDPTTKIIPSPAPDASGLTYLLTRVRDGRNESANIVLDANGQVNIEFSRHFYETTEGQKSEPAFLSDRARKCIEDKLR